MRQQTYASQIRHYDRHMHTYRIGEITASAEVMTGVSADPPRVSSAHHRFA